MKLVLWEQHLKVNNSSYFPTLLEVNERWAHNAEKYSNCTMTLTEEYNDRFCELKARDISIKMFASPFSLEIGATPINLQTELANFQSDLMLKEKGSDSSRTDICSIYVFPPNYPEIKKTISVSIISAWQYQCCEQLTKGEIKKQDTSY
jgi:hypothetical protein